jgi:peptidoglycan/LPS O-acetylase OafA/YrhL
MTQEVSAPESLPGVRVPVQVPPKRCLELDGLRGIAALCAVLYHYTDRASRLSPALKLFRHILNISPAAMDMFFILSGFLIGGILLKTTDSPNYYKTFYLRRFFRIIPIYYLWIAVFGVAAYLAPSVRQTLPKGYTLPLVIGAYLIFVQNFASPVLRVIWLEATWSLAVEEHFYLFMPACVRRFSVKQLVQGLTAIVIISPAVRVALSVLLKRDGSDAGWWSVYGWTISRVDALALGVLLSIAWANPKARIRIRENISWVYRSMVALFVCSAIFEYFTMKEVRHTQALTDGFGRTALELFSLCLMVIALVNQGKPSAAFMRWPWLRQIGQLSYCIYLTHWGIFWAVLTFGFHARAGLDVNVDLIAGGLALALTLALSQISWTYLEGPMLKRSHRYSY